MVARRGDQFINIRIKGASGAFDPADAHLQDLLGAAPPGTAQPRAEPRPVFEAAGDADRDSHHHDTQVFLAEVNHSGHREHDGRESRNDAPRGTSSAYRSMEYLNLKKVTTSWRFYETKPMCPLPVVSRPLSVAKLKRSRSQMGRTNPATRNSRRSKPMTTNRFCETTPPIYCAMNSAGDLAGVWSASRNGDSFLGSPRRSFELGETLRRDQADFCAAHAGGCMLRNPYCAYLNAAPACASMRSMCAAWRGPVRFAGYRWFAGRTAGRARILFRTSPDKRPGSR